MPNRALQILNSALAGAKNVYRLAYDSIQIPARTVWSFVTKYWVRVFIVTCLGIYGSEKLHDTDFWLNARYKIFQSLQYLSPRSSDPKRTVLVIIGDDEYYGPELKGRSPIRRDYLARIVDSLSAANAAVIALDFNFCSPSPTGDPVEEDEYYPETKKLREAIFNASAAGRKVVVTKSLGQGADDLYFEVSDVYGTDLGSWRNVRTGFDVLPDDVRNLPLAIKNVKGGLLESFALAIARSENASSLNNIPDFTARYYAGFLPPEKFTPASLSSSEFLSGKTDLVANKVVFVSGAWHEFSKGSGPVVTSWDSPVGHIPGVLFHANYFEALFDSRFYRIWEGWPMIATEFVLSFMVALPFYLVITSRHWKLILYLLPYVVILAISYVSLINFGWFFDPLIPILAVGAHGILEQVHRWRSRAKSSPNLVGG